MPKLRILSVITLAILLVTQLTVPVAAQTAGELTIVGKLGIAERAIYGATQTGALVERISKLERDIFGSEASSALAPRVDKVYSYTLQTDEQAPSLITKLNAVEWTLTHSVSNNPLKTRIENLEKTINGSPTTGSINERIERLLNYAYTGGQFEVKAVTIVKDTLVKIKTLSTLNSKKSRPGDSVALAIAEDVMIDGVLVLPKGAKGIGKVVKVQQSGNFGRDAKIEISFDSLDAVDGSSVNTYLGDKAKEQTKSLAKAAGASVAGMVILGPVGIIGGAFVNGKEANIPIGSQMYIQTKDSVEVYGIIVK